MQYRLYIKMDTGEEYPPRKTSPYRLRFSKADKTTGE